MKKLLLLSITSLTMLIADFTLEGDKLTPVSTQSGGTNVSTTIEAPSSTNKYLEPVDIPAYDPNDSTHVLITPTNGMWNESVLNNLSYKHFYITPGNYLGSTIWLRSAGTENDRRTLSLYNPSNPTNDTHPGALPDNEQANCKFSITDQAHYWTIDRLSNLDDPSTSYAVTIFGGADYTILNRLHIRNAYKGIYIYPGSDFNTVQNCYLDTATHAGRVNDALGVGIRHDGAAFSEVLATKIINNDIRNYGDGIQLIKKDVGATNFEGTIIDSNRIWIDSDIYTNGDWSTNGYNAGGKYAVAENAIDVKAGSDNAANPVIISNNICWGYREIDTTTGQNSIAGVPINVSYQETKNIIYDSNIVFDSEWGMHLMNLTGTGSKIINNIMFDIGHITPSIPKFPNGRDVWVFSIPRESTINSSTGVLIGNNSIINTGVNPTTGGRALYAWTNADVMELNNNLFIDTINIHGDYASNSRDNNWYYNHAGAKLSGTNENDMSSTNPQMGDYTFVYEQFTSQPKTKTLAGVISTMDSPHYQKAGSSIGN